MEEKFIPADKQNFDRRQLFIILHYTVLDEKDSVETLTHGGVRTHFLIPKQAFKNEGELFDYYQFLDINDRAWHAGISEFSGRKGLNDTSIGIEIVNYGYSLIQASRKAIFSYQIENQLKEIIIQTLQEQDKILYHTLIIENLLSAFLSDMLRGLMPPSDREIYKEKVSSDRIKKYKQLTKEWREKNDIFVNIKQEDLYQLEQQGKLVWDDYTEHQINTLVNLVKNIQEKLITKGGKSREVYCQILPQFITGHIDIAPGRKTDPGPHLWKKLADRGIGAWPDEQLVATIKQEIQIEQGVDYKWIQDNLRVYGYKIESTGELDEQTRDVIRAFQIHFEPDYYSGEPSVETISLLEALVKKYYPNQQSDYPRAFKPSNEKSNFFFREARVNVGIDPVNAFNCCVIS